jgi:hypothetical protein
MSTSGALGYVQCKKDALASTIDCVRTLILLSKSLPNAAFCGKKVKSCLT